MEIFGRPPSSYRRAVQRIPQLGRQIARATQVFRSPWRYMAAYLFEKPLTPRVVEFRDGLRIALSNHPRDLATVFVVFIRRDYGPIPTDETVVDIGANIGIFSLYAAREGARRILSFEPSKESFDRLQENVRCNGLADTILPFRLAVTNGATAQVRFPLISDPSNRIASADVFGAEAVPTTTLDEIVAHRVGGKVSLMKIDCEGAEYEIIAATLPDTWKRVSTLRLEYHDGRAAELIDTLARTGFRLSHHVTRTVGGQQQGDLWFER